mmetsp:Transcript_62279/g.148666  ORF Transcript_62279/g.148666 Transcript_62279/m.148666 type:complete len:347 (-) Transcript_62279:138-1178(-)
MGARCCHEHPASGPSPYEAPGGLESIDFGKKQVVVSQVAFSRKSIDDTASTTTMATQEVCGVVASDILDESAEPMKPEEAPPTPSASFNYTLPVETLPTTPANLYRDVSAQSEVMIDGPPTSIFVADLDTIMSHDIAGYSNSLSSVAAASVPETQERYRHQRSGMMMGSTLDNLEALIEEMDDVKMQQVVVELNKKSPTDSSSPGPLLGLFVHNLQEHGVVQVLQIEDGCIVAHANRQNAKDGKPFLKEKDIIVKVNEAQGKCAEILQECKRSTVLRMKILRPVPCTPSGNTLPPTGTMDDIDIAPPRGAATGATSARSSCTESPTRHMMLKQKVAQLLKTEGEAG